MSKRCKIILKRTKIPNGELYEIEATAECWAAIIESTEANKDLTIIEVTEETSSETKE